MEEVIVEDYMQTSTCRQELVAWPDPALTLGPSQRLLKHGPWQRGTRCFGSVCRTSRINHRVSSRVGDRTSGRRISGQISRCIS